MLGIVFLSLFLMVVVAGGIGLAMFVDVAIAGPNRGLAPAVAASGRCDGAGLALRVERAVSRAVARVGVESAAAGRCGAACHQGEIRVTTPEVLAIVQELHERQSPAQRNSIRMQAQQNVLAADGAHRCPLLLAGGFCACDVARPVSCRTYCAAGADSPDEAHALAETVGAGVTEVFQSCLHASGLDDSRYELNQALLQTLNTPHAARRWARGERILESAVENS